MNIWKIDLGHSQVNFSVRHLMITTVRGVFARFDGEIKLDPTNFSTASVDLRIDVSSLNTGETQRDEHLQREDFFDAQQFPTMRFRSREVEQLNPREAVLNGDLTIKGITLPVRLHVTHQGQQIAPDGQTHHGFHAVGDLNRDDWGLNWNVVLDNGGWLVGKSIKLEIDLGLIQT